MEESAMGAFANRLQQEFEAPNATFTDPDESQDWFVNDSPTKEQQHSIDSEDAESSPVAPPRTIRSVSTPVTPTTHSIIDKEYETWERLEDPMAFLQHTPPRGGNFVMELTTSSEVPRYGTKVFRIFLPQVHENQTDFCLFARKRQKKNKIRFSLDEKFSTKWTEACYSGKLLMTLSATIKRFRLVSSTPANRISFDIKQETRKQELHVHFNSTSNRFNFFRPRAASADSQNDVYSSNIQKFINPMADIRCSNTNYTLFKMEKESDVDIQKYIISYMRPFSLFLSCCIAVGMEAHLLD